MSLIKTAKFTSPFQIKVAEEQIPEPDDNEVLVKVKCAGICGTDFKIYDGSIPYLKEGTLNYPLVPGHEWSGDVVKVGSNVIGYKTGDRVTGECHIGCGKCEDCLRGKSNICLKRVRLGIMGLDGAFSEYLVIPEKALHCLTDNVSYLEGALVEPLTIALHALDKLEGVAGSNVLIFGLGPIGLLNSQVAKVMGAANVIGVDLDPNRLEIGQQVGCDFVTSHSGQDLSDYLSNVTNGHGVDIIVEATGVKALLTSAIELIRPGGQISLLGLYNGKVEIDPTTLITKDIRVYGNMASARIWDRAIRLIDSKKIDVKPIISHKFAFDEIEAAMKKAYNKEDGCIKVMLKMD